MMLIPSLMLRIAVRVELIWVSRLVATPSPAASSAALLTRRPLEMRDSELARLLLMRPSWPAPLRADTLVRTDMDIGHLGAHSVQNDSAG